MREVSPPPSKQVDSKLTGAFARLYWMLGGNAALSLLAIGIAQQGPERTWITDTPVRKIDVTTGIVRRWHAAVLALSLLAGCASVQSVPAAARSDLVPTGKLRVGLILSNQVLVTKDPQTGELRGVTVILGKALAKRLGVPFEPVGYPNPAALVQSFGRNEWDIAFLAFDPARARDVEFSSPYMVVDNTYLVPLGSKVETVEAADQRGVRVAVPERSAPDLFLSRNLKDAEIVRVPGGADAAIETLRSGRADAYAENAHMLSLYSEKLPGSRVLLGRYTVIQHAVATPKGRPAGAGFLKAFVEECKRDGTVRAAITQAGLRRTEVAPAAATE